MAYVTGSNGSGTPPDSSSDTPSMATGTGAGGSSGLDAQQFNLLMAFVQQQQQQQQQQQPPLAPVAPAPVQLPPAVTPQPSALNPPTNVYQQLLIQQLLAQQQQQQQPQPPPRQSPPQQDAAAANFSLQQALAQLQQSQQATPQPQPVAPAPAPAPAQLTQNLFQAQQTINQPGMNVGALLLALQQQQQQQQQVNLITSLLSSLNPSAAAAAFQQPNGLQTAQQAAMPNAALFAPQQQPTPVQDDTKPLLEYIQLLRRHQEQQVQQQQLAAVLAAAVGNPAPAPAPIQGQPPPPVLSSQNSSSSLLASPAPNRPTEAVYVSIPSSSAQPSSTMTDHHSGGHSHSNPSSVQGPSSSGGIPSSRQMSTERILASGQTIEDHISRLISENAAIVEPDQVLLKRRPYNRQNTSNSITSQTSSTGGDTLSAAGSPQSAYGARQNATRSQSLHEPALLAQLRPGATTTNGGSITSGQPIARMLSCKSCNVKFPHEASLERHEARCGKKELLLKQHSQPHLLSSVTSSTSGLTPQQFVQQQQKLQAEHQARISALVGGGAGVAPDVFHNSASHRSPPIKMLTASDRRESKKRLLDNVNFEACPEDQPCNSKSGRPASTSGSGGSHVNGSSTGGSGMPPLGLGYLPKIESMDTELAPKMAKMDFGNYSLSDLSHDVQSANLQQQIFDQPSREVIQDFVTAFRNLPSFTTHGDGQLPGPMNSLFSVGPTEVASMPFIVLDPSPEAKATRESVQLQIAFMERGIEPKPYIVSFALNENQMPPIVDDDVNAAVNRRMLKTLTHYTPICPTVGHPRVTKRGESQFAYYSQSVASPETVEQLFQYLACYSTRPHINDKGYCKYTIAGLADKSTRPIHSSTVSTIVSYHQVKSEYDEVDTLLRARAMFESSNAVFSNHHTVQKPPQQPVQALDLSLGESKHRYQPQKVSEAPTQPSQAAVITANPPAVQQPKPIPLQALQQVNQHSDRVRSCDLASNKQLFPGAEYARIAAKIKPTPRSEEVEVYVRGRGRGRYVCERCGIKCRKPSMLKKHLRSHTNIRPFSCVTCNFSFKTKGNLTKHLYSKGHRKKLEEQGGVTVTSQSQGGFPEMGGAFSDLTAAADLLLPIVSERQKKLSLDIPENDDEEFDDDDEDADDEDEEEDDEVNFALPIKPSNDKTKISHRRFGQENIIYERDTHTPPTLWMLCEEKKHDDWPKPDTERSCHTAPPVFDTDGSAVNDSPPRTHSKKVSQPALMLYPQLPQAQEVLPVDGNDAAKALLTAMLAMTPVLPPAEPNFGFITLQQLTHDASMSQFVDQVKRGNLDSQKLLIDVAKAAASAVPSQQETLVGVPLVAEREILEPLPSSISALSTGGRKRKTTTGSLIGVAEPPPAKQRFLSSSNPQQASTSASSSSSTSAAAAAAATSSTSWSLSCEDCGKRYRKQSDLNIHRETHFIEKSRSKVYTCEVCKCVCRTKVMLQRHKEQGCRPPPPPTTTIINGRLPPGSASTAAVGGGSEPALISLSTPGAGSAFSQPQQTSSGANNLTNFSGMMPAGFANGLTLNTQIGGPMAFSASTSSQVSTSALSASSSSSSLGPGASSGRSFRCTDCNTGFRSHGVLTKHLRSKQHVLKLCYNGILPDYAMALIKENATQLATVDASDCDNARESIKALIDRLRNNQQQQQQLPPAFSTTLPQGTRSGAVSSQSSSSSPTASLECTEQLSALSPTPRVPQQSQSQSQNPPAVSSDFRLCGSSTNNSTKPATLSPVPLVPAAKKNVCRGAEDLDEQPQQPQDYPSPVSTPHPNHLTVDTVGVNGRQTFSGNSLLLGGHLGHQVSRMVVSDVWIPPKGDEIPIVDSSTPVMAVSPASFEPRPPDSVGDGGNTSDATSRSATSTPKNNLRRSSLANGGGGGGGGQQQAAYGPFPQPFLLTMCQVCGAHFDSPMDLQIHFQCEHIRLQDGSYLRCPTSECDKVYPSQDALRTHLVSHYRVSPSRGLLLHPNSDEKDDDLSPTPAMSQSSISPDDILSNGGAASPGRLLTQKNTRTATTAPKNSPGAPEESHTTDSPRQQTSKTYTCPICYDPFADMDALKVHVLGHLEADQGPHQPTH